MSGPLFLRLSEQNFLFKQIEVNVPTPYSNKRSLKLGFIPTPQGSFNGMDKINAALAGRVSPISLSQAERLAGIISGQFSFPVRVVKELKVPIDEANTVLEKDGQGNQRPKGHLTADEVWAPTALEFENVGLFRNVMQFLVERVYISAQDKIYLEPFIYDVEMKLAFAAKLTPTISLKQKEIIRKVCLPHIQAIIAACKSEEATNEGVLGQVTCFRFEATFSRRNLALGLLIESMQRDCGTLFLEQFNGLSTSCMNSGQALSKIYEGNAKIEPLFANHGSGVPLLTAQRQAILELIEEQLIEHFGPEEDPQTADRGWTKEYLQALRSRLFGEGYRLDTIGIVHNETPPQLILQPFRAVLDALNDDFGTTTFYPQSNRHVTSPKHYWFAENGVDLEGDAARNRFFQLKAEVEKAMGTHDQSTPQ